MREWVLPQLRAHADLIDPIAFEQFLRGTADGLDFDVMLEAKGKDLALLRLREHLGRETALCAPNLTRARVRIGHNTNEFMMSTLVGMQLSGRYRLDAQIGAGGMSTVYRAFDVNLERRVAIKLLHREMSADSDQLERFRREARAVAQLSHPHIVGVIDAGEDENRPYIVFEYVEGETLKDRIRRLGRLQVDESLAYAIEIARALGCAHAHEIVHRDVKPQNVLLDAEGLAKVTDFGIARSLRDDSLTADGRVLGTTDYVSPEQALGHDVDGQSDIYSLGVVLYEMLTGEVPFHGENQISVAMKHVREDLPDIQRARPEVSATTAAVLDRMTDKDLAHRYADVPSLVADLEDALALEAARHGTVDRRGHRGHPHAPGPRTPPAPVSDAPLAAGAGHHRPGRGRRRDRRDRRRGEVPPRVERGTGAGPRRGHARGHAGRLGPARLRPRLRPARRRRGALRRGRPHRRPRRGHVLDDRALQRRPGGRGQGGRRPLHRRQAQGRGRPDPDRDPEPGLEGDDLRRPARLRAQVLSTAGRRSAAARSTARTSASSSTRAAPSYRYYLVWITKLADGADRVEISEIRLFQEIAAVALDSP